jgi:uncharacterized protein YjbJ (UPF0337 family)
VPGQPFDDRKEPTVTTDRLVDKARNAARRGEGQAKQAAGRASGDESLRARGLLDEAVADVRQVAGKSKELIQDAGDKVGRAARGASAKARESARGTRDRLKRPR